MALGGVVLLLATVATAAEAEGSSVADSVSQQRGTAGVGTRVTPLQKVLEMLDEMNAKGKMAKHKEEVEFAEFHEWCDEVRASRTKSIKEAKAQILQLQADIEKAEADAESLAAEIKDLEAAIDKADAEAASATSVREKEHSDYAAQHQDLSESIDAIARALQTLKARSEDVPQSLAQLRKLQSVPQDAKVALTSFLALRESDEINGVPEANAYEFQSGGVVAMLEKLALQFKDQLLAVQKAEMSAKANYKVLMQQLQDNIKADAATVAAKTKTKTQRLDDAALFKGDLASTEATLAEDEKTLSDTNSECQARSDEFEKNQLTRAEEVKAIEKAIEILSSSSVSGHAATYLPTLLQLSATAGGQSLAQLQSGRQWDPTTRAKAVQFLQSRARMLGSRFLSVAAARAAEDPFDKVKKMIKDLIVKLMEQANAEADQHAYCITELATNKETRNNKAAEVEELTATMDQLIAESAQLASEVETITDSVAEIKAQQAEATKIRSEEKAVNAKTVADAKDAQVAIQKASEVLRAYYAKAASTDFLQNAHGSDAGEVLSAEMSQAAHAPYKGQQSASTGVLGMLEVVLSDFARLDAQTHMAEEAAAAAHRTFMAETNETVAVKQREMEHKTNKRQLTDEKTRSVKKELKLTQEELAHALEYYDKLKAECLDTGLSYQDRVHAREQEIQSLKEALAILEQSDLA